MAEKYLSIGCVIDRYSYFIGTMLDDADYMFFNVLFSTSCFHSTGSKINRSFWSQIPWFIVILSVFCVDYSITIHLSWFITIGRCYFLAVFYWLNYFSSSTAWFIWNFCFNIRTFSFQRLCFTILNKSTKPTTHDTFCNILFAILKFFIITSDIWIMIKYLGLFNLFHLLPILLLLILINWMGNRLHGFSFSCCIHIFKFNELKLLKKIFVFIVILNFRKVLVCLGIIISTFLSIIRL